MQSQSQEENSMSSSLRLRRFLAQTMTLQKFFHEKDHRMMSFYQSITQESYLSLLQDTENLSI